ILATTTRPGSEPRRNRRLLAVNEVNGLVPIASTPGSPGEVSPSLFCGLRFRLTAERPRHDPGAPASEPPGSNSQGDPAAKNNKILTNRFLIFCCVRPPTRSFPRSESSACSEPDQLSAGAAIT